jgi:deoxyribodipyrimidine photo-lyase
MSSNVVVWFRNDLRIADNTALSSAVKFILKNKSSQTAKGRVYGLFLVSPYEWVTLNKWGLPKCDYYVRNAIALQTELAKYNVSLTVRLIRSKIPITVDDSVEFDPPADKLNHAIGEIAQEVLSAMNSLESSHCFVNRSYDSVSLDIEREVHGSLSKSGFTLHSFDDECVVPVNSVRSQSGTMPKVYSPFKKLWTLYIEVNGVGVIDTRQHLSSLNQVIADIRVHKQDNMVSAANEKLKSNESVFGRPEEFFETVEEAVRSSNVLNMLSEMPEFACMNLEKFAQDFSGGEISAMNDLNTFFDEMLAARDSSPGYKVLRDSHSRGGASRMPPLWP